MSAVPALLDACDSAFDILPYNRRVAIRYPCGLATSTSVKLLKAAPFQRVQAHNISQGGMGVILDQPPEQGVAVHIRVRNKILNFTYDLSAEVAHVAVRDDGSWLVGLAFARQLTRGELASLL